MPCLGACFLFACGRVGLLSPGRTSPPEPLFRLVALLAWGETERVGVESHFFFLRWSVGDEKLNNREEKAHLLRFVFFLSRSLFFPKNELNRNPGRNHALDPVLEDEQQQRQLKVEQPERKRNRKRRKKRRQRKERKFFFLRSGQAHGGASRVELRCGGADAALAGLGRDGGYDLKKKEEEELRRTVL